MQIDSAKIEGFKNWFFGRVPNQLIELDEEFDSLEIVVSTENDLPVIGEAGKTYTVQETQDNYRFVDGGYEVINPYIWGVEDKYREPTRRVYPKKLLEDHSWSIPFIPDERLRETDNAPLATLYNISALLLDLQQIRRFHVEGFKTTTMDYLGQGKWQERERNVTEWFQREHKKLYQLLNSSMRSQTQIYKPVIDALFKHGYILTWDPTRNRAKFKVEDLVVYI